MGRARKLGLICGLLLLVVGGASLAWWSLMPQRPTTNLLLITLDTTRADRLGCYGYSAALTPALDRLAAEGILFERATAPAPLTLPSHASMFTGLYPPEHGLRTNGRGQLGTQVPTVVQAATAAGYDTAAFLASFVLNKKFGLAPGFATYDDDLSGTAPTDDALHRQRDGKIVVDAALNWLGQPREKPFFCWVHLYDAHHPYLRHKEEFGNRFDENLYDGELAYVDRQVQRLLDHLKETGKTGETLIVVVGDHGEGLGQHLERTHGYTLYEATQHVPLIMHWPGRIAPGQRCPTATPLVDLGPTLCELLGLKGLGTVSGRSLAPALTGAALNERPCFAATDDPFLQNGWSPQQSLTANRWKYIRTSIPELYDLTADPGETRNLAESEPARAKELAAQLDQMVQTFVIHEAADAQLTAAEWRILESLGYVGGVNSQQLASAAKGPATGGLPDVKEFLPFDIATQDAIDLLHSGKRKEAIAELEKVVALAPRHLDARVFLGEALLDDGQPEAAILALEEALRIKPDHLNARLHLGAARMAQGKADEAIAHLDEALRIDPDSAIVRYNLGMALLQQDAAAEGISQLEEALRLDEALPDVRPALANALVRLGRPAEAREILEQELAAQPRSVEARVNLAVLLAEDDPERAGTLLQEAVKIAPDNPQAQYNLGAFLLMRDQPAEAIAPLKRALELMPDHPRAGAELERAQQKATRQ